MTPDDPRLWCALGDLTLSDAHYETAWERSRQRSTRAQRSLARSAQREKDFEGVRACPALHCNVCQECHATAVFAVLVLGKTPLHSEGWLFLGYCALYDACVQSTALHEWGHPAGSTALAAAAECGVCSTQRAERCPSYRATKQCKGIGALHASSSERFRAVP